jgi:hypothetical protein
MDELNGSSIANGIRVLMPFAASKDYYVARSEVIEEIEELCEFFFMKKESMSDIVYKEGIEKVAKLRSHPLYKYDLQKIEKLKSRAKRVEPLSELEKIEGLKPQPKHNRNGDILYDENGNIRYNKPKYMKCHCCSSIIRNLPRSLSQHYSTGKCQIITNRLQASADCGIEEESRFVPTEHPIYISRENLNVKWRSKNKLIYEDVYEDGILVSRTGKRLWMNYKEFLVNMIQARYKGFRTRKFMKKFKGHEGQLNSIKNYLNNDINECFEFTTKKGKVKQFKKTNLCVW